MKQNFRFGIKISIKDFQYLNDIYSNRNLIDFIEIILLPNFNINDLEKIKAIKVPYSIHFPNSINGIDFGNKNKNTNNIRLINKINKNLNHFKQLKPICYIVHPESGNIDISICNIKKLKINPIAIENMPKKSLFGGDLLGYCPNTLKRYFNSIPDLEFCFDINHAIKTAISKKIDYLKFLKDFLEFKKPILFHIAGGNLNCEVDQHLNLYVGDYNTSEIKKILIKYDLKINLTFETPKVYENRIENDLKNMRFFLKS